MSSPYCESADTFRCQYTQMQFGCAWSSLKYVDGAKKKKKLLALIHRNWRVAFNKFLGHTQGWFSTISPLKLQNISLWTKFWQFISKTLPLKYSFQAVFISSCCQDTTFNKYSRLRLMCVAGNNFFPPFNRRRQ